MSEFSFELLDQFLNKSTIHDFGVLNRNDSNIELFVKRDDLIHNEFSGNKLRKLKYNIKSYYDNKCYGLLTFGGAYSNHLLATASACNYFGIKSIGVVRGNELNGQSNELLARCCELGMRLLFFSRVEYDKIKKTTGRQFFDGNEYWIIPEGGANREGVIGCREIVSNCNFDYFVVAQGTSTTSLGMLLELNDFQKLIVVPVLKGFDSAKEMKLLLGNDGLFEIISKKLIVLDQFHFGGYAKITDELNSFVTNFNKSNQFKIEPIYTGKVLFALSKWLRNIEENKKVLFVHTGGLQNFNNEFNLTS
jgi:1-aminocyclopropane-1-carboxylate deaminase